MFTERHQQIIEAYLNKESAADIARRFGVSRSRIYRLLGQYPYWHGVMGDKSKLRADRNEKIRAEYAKGTPVAEIAAELSVSKKTVSNAVSEIYRDIYTARRTLLAEMYLLGKTYKEISEKTGYKQNSVRNIARAIFMEDWENAKKSRVLVAQFNKSI